MEEENDKGRNETLERMIKGKSVREGREMVDEIFEKRSVRGKNGNDRRNVGGEKCLNKMEEGEGYGECIGGVKETTERILEERNVGNREREMHLVEEGSAGRRKKLWKGCGRRKELKKAREW